jgi:enamine deaminase RidA (YjgF/YER057c/UK114 family)
VAIERWEGNERSSQATAFASLVFVAGQVARDNAHASVAEQTREALQRIDNLLVRAGSDKTLLLNATIWLRRATAYTEMNRVWVDWLPAGCGPARAVIEGGMMSDGWDVEIAVVAARM